MSEDEELERLRQRRMAEMQAQANQQANENLYEQQQAAQYEAQKQAILQQILSSDARSRLTNLKMARPDFAYSVENQLIQLAQSGALRGKIPLSDDIFKNLLQQLQERSKKHETKIRII